MLAGKEAQPECISQRASSGRLNCSCSKSRDLTAINPVVPRLSHEDELQGESNSISNQKRILETYAKQNGFTNLRWYTDDGFSGANFAEVR